jgi:hypothetical protein
MTDILDVASKSGGPKITKIRELKNRGPYLPQTDFYKPLREGIIKVHQSGKPKSTLQAILLKVNAKKLANYKAALDGYEKWWGTRTLTWFDPPSGSYSGSGFEIRINPELGLEIGGQRQIIKLFLRDQNVSKLRIDLMNALMAQSLPGSMNATCNVLDVRRSTPIGAPANCAALISVVDAELATIAKVWPTV